MWSTEGYEVELKVDPLDDNDAMLVGQILGESAADLEVVLRQKGCIKSVSRSDSAGQFLLKLDLQEPSKLSIRFADGSRAEIPVEV